MLEHLEGQSQKRDRSLNADTSTSTRRSPLARELSVVVPTEQPLTLNDTEQNDRICDECDPTLEMGGTGKIHRNYVRHQSENPSLHKITAGNTRLTLQ